MEHFKHRATLFFFVVVLTFPCCSQVNESGGTSLGGYNRAPVVAGQFYPADSAELSQMLINLFIEADKITLKGLRAIIVPHAGYVFSGHVAASGYNQMDLSQPVKTVFILSSSHRANYNGASIYTPGNYETPLGEVQTNREITEILLKDSDVFHYVPEAHTKEHSLEVQLPFLQHRLEKDLTVVPIVIGTQSIEECKEIAAGLKPFFKPENLFVVSTDFSHFPEYSDALKWDEKTADSILLNSAKAFIAAINDPADDNARGLSTRVCGWSSLLTLLLMTEEDPHLKYYKVLYQNSGDSDYGDKQRVVGYYALALADAQQNSNDERFELNLKERKILLHHARESILCFLNNGETCGIDIDTCPENLIMKYGAFVTLHKKGELRGCIGTFTANEPLIKAVEKMAIASATEDRRFIPVNLAEMGLIKIEISVLTPLKRIESIDDIVLGKHGIYIKKGIRTGTFLPQVADETQWTKEEFLGHCSRDKAGIGWDGWKDAELFTYEAFVFSE